MKIFNKYITKKKVLFHIAAYVEKVARLPYVNWFNPLITIYLNFRSFTFRQACKFPVFVYGWPKLFSLYGTMECVGKCKTGMIILNKTNCGMPENPGVNTAINNWGKIIFHGNCEILTANKINVTRDATLELGDNTRIMCNCNITAHQLVRIGNSTWLVHRSQVMDSNFHYIANFNNYTIPRFTRPIEIGDYCWICNSSTIAPGTKIPNKTIVASNSLVNKDMSDIPEGSMIGGTPAKLLKTGFRRVDDKELEHEIWEYFKDNPKEKYFHFKSDNV